MKLAERSLSKVLITTLLPLTVILLSAGSMLSPPVHAQTPVVTATPGYINFGMTTTISVTAPSAGTYSVVVIEPNGASVKENYTFASSGQNMNSTFGNATVGFGAAVKQVGTYNVYVEQGTTLVGSTSFYATNKLDVTMDVVQAGICTFAQTITRGEQFIPRFYVHYASNGAPMTNDTPGASINFTTPSGQEENAPWDGYSGLFDNAVSPNWNYTDVGAWSPTVTASDAFGNTGTYTYTGSPYVILPAELSTAITFVSTSTGQGLTSLANGTAVTIMADIEYPGNAEPVQGFVGPLDPSRGAVVTAQVGWGVYNMTTGTFGGGKSPGALIGTVLMTYSASSMMWAGQFESSSLPAVPAGMSYEVAVSSRDSASPANTGFGIATLAPATAVSTKTSTQTATQTVVQTSSSTLTQTVVQASSTTLTQTSVQTVQSIPDVVYAALVILLIVGLLIGFIVRMPREK